MRKLRLQVQITIDGFVARSNGDADWMVTEGDSKAIERVVQIAEDSGIILMGRKMSPGFIGYWENVVNSNDTSNPEWGIATRMVNTEKIVFSKTLKSIEGKNVRVENGDLKTEVNKLKNQPGKDLLVYGGANFVSNLIKEDLIDDYYLFVNPVAIGDGMKIFLGDRKLKLVESIQFGHGEMLNHYQPAR